MLKFIVIGCLLLFVGMIVLALYIKELFDATEKDYMKILNVCETVYDLNAVSKVTVNDHFMETIKGRDPIKLYPQHIQERYKEKYG